MSLEAILIGTERHLQTVALGWQSNEVGLMPTGQPPPSAGQRFLAVYPVSWTNLAVSPIEGFEEVYGIGVCVTYRFGYAPGDRRGRELVVAKSGLLRVGRLVMYAVHGNYVLMNLANAEIPATENNIGEPLAFKGGTFSEKGPDWFEASAGKEQAGYVMDLRFEGGKRLQPLPL